jgi:hypothetical protein
MKIIFNNQNNKNMGEEKYYFIVYGYKSFNQTGEGNAVTTVGGGVLDIRQMEKDVAIHLNFDKVWLKNFIEISKEIYDASK